jgi:hypothetical protein
MDRSSKSQIQAIYRHKCAHLSTRRESDKGHKPAPSAAFENDQLVADHKRANSVVACAPAGIPNYVRVAWKIARFRSILAR